jgi:hypothetical protein
MDTPNGLVVLGPKGQRLRLQSNHPAYRAGRDIVRQSLPAEQAWQRLQDLMANPLKAVVDWCERFGLAFTGDDDTLHVNDKAFSRMAWLPLFQRAQGVGADPRHLLRFAEKLGGMAEAAQVGQVALHLQEDKLGGQHPAVLRLMGLPAEARPGDIVNTTSTGPAPFLVSFDEFSVSPTGQLVVEGGVVLSRVEDEKEAADILLQPMILGFNRTYRCEEGTVSGWLEDMSFDSLTAAQRNAKEIQDSGGEARIINRITGETVALQ